MPSIADQVDVCWPIRLRVELSSHPSHDYGVP